MDELTEFEKLRQQFEGAAPTPQAAPQSEEEEFAALEAEFKELDAQFGQQEQERNKAQLTEKQLAELEQKYKDSPSGMFATFMQHAAKGATAGTLDEIAGFTRAAILPESGKETPDEDISYVDRAQRTQEAYDWLLDKSAEDNPISAFAGDVTGSIFGVGKMVKGVKSAAAFGALEGATRSKADIMGSNRDLAKLMFDSSLGGLVGGGSYWAMGKLWDKVSSTETGKKIGDAVSRKFKDVADELLPPSNKDTLFLIEKTNEVLNNKADDIQRMVGVMDDVGIARKEQFVEKFELFGTSAKKSFREFRKATADMSKSQRRRLAMDAMDTPGIVPSKEMVEQAAKQAYREGDSRLLQALRKIEAKKGELTPLDLVKLDMRSQGLNTSADNVSGYLAFRKFEHEMAGYARYVSGKPPLVVDPTKSVDADRLVGRQVADLRQSFKESIAQGRVNGDTYHLYKAHEASMEVAAKYNDEVLAGFRQIDPVAQSKMFRYTGDVRYVAAKIDNKVGTDVGALIDDVYVAQNNHTAFTHKYLSKAMEIIRRRRDSGIGSRELYGAKSVGEKSPIVAQMDELFEQVRQEANQMGMNIVKKENYIRTQAKAAHELVPEVQRWYKELKGDVMDSYFSGLSATGADKKAWRKLFKDNKAGREYAQQHNAVESITGETIQSRLQLKQTIDQLGDLLRQKESPLYKAGMALRRRGTLPERLRETDADRLMVSYINDISKALHMTGPLQQIQSRAALLKKLGMGQEAKYLDTYVQNMSGMPSGLAKMSVNARNAYKEWAQKVAEKDPAFGAITAAPEVWDIMAQSIYPNMLGMNVKATLRNYTQPFLMTATDVNQGLMSMYGQRVAGRSAAKSFQRLGSLADDLQARGLAPAEFVGEGSEMLGAEFRDGLTGMTARGVKKWNTWVMKMYGGSDTLNRHITMNMADIVTADLRSALRNPGKLTRNERAAKEFLATMEPGYRNRVREIIRKEGQITDEVGQEIAKYLVAKTQLVYGKAGMSQLQRDAGSFLSMFTKWPTAVTSEIAYELSENGMKGGSKLMRKYFAPYLAMYGAYQMAGNKEPSPRDKVFLDPNPSYYTPLNSLGMVVKGDLVPPPAKAFTEVSKAALSGDADKTQKALKQAAKVFVPVVGWGINAYDTFYTKLYKDEKPK